MSDLIKRSDALSLAKDVCVPTADGSVWRHRCIDPDQIRELPSAERKGKWIPLFGEKFVGGAYWFECSKCKRIVPEVHNGGWNYCPNCGSYNGGEEDE